MTLISLQGLIPGPNSKPLDFLVDPFLPLNFQASCQGSLFHFWCLVHWTIKVGGKDLSQEKTPLNLESARPSIIYPGDVWVLLALTSDLCFAWLLCALTPAWPVLGAEVWPSLACTLAWSSLPSSSLEF